MQMMNKLEALPDILTAAEAQEVLRTSNGTFYSVIVGEGYLLPIMRGRRRFYRKDDVLALLRSGWAKARTP